MSQEYYDFNNIVCLYKNIINRHNIDVYVYDYKNICAMWNVIFYQNIFYIFNALFLTQKILFFNFKNIIIL